MPEDNPITEQLIEWRNTYQLTLVPTALASYCEMLGWIRHYFDEDGPGMLRCGENPEHSTAWVHTSKKIHPVGSGKHFGPYPDTEVLWCSDCKRVLAAYDNPTEAGMVRPHAIQS